MKSTFLCADFSKERLHKNNLFPYRKWCNFEQYRFRDDDDRRRSTCSLVGWFLYPKMLWLNVNL